jgi:hypothetical protein
MEDAAAEGHSRLRSDMKSDSMLLRDEIRKDVGRLDDRLTKIEHAVTKIETRAEDRNERDKRNIAVYSSVSVLVMTILIELFKFLVHK